MSSHLDLYMRTRHSSSPSGPRRPTRSPCHFLFIALAIVTAASCAGLIFGRVAPLVLLSARDFRNMVRRGGLFYWAHKFASGLLHASFVLVELEGNVPYVLPEGTLDNWIQRGFLYAFAALPDVAETVRLGGDSSSVGSFRDAFGPGLPVEGKVVRLAEASTFYSARTLAVCGAVYLLLGLSCMKKTRDECRRSYDERMQKFRDERPGSERRMSA